MFHFFFFFLFLVPFAYPNRTHAPRLAASSPENFAQSLEDDHGLWPARENSDTSKVEKEVAAMVRAQGVIPEALVESEVAWFFDDLGIGKSYFLDTKPAVLAQHVLAIFGAKVNNASCYALEFFFFFFFLLFFL